MKRITLTLPNGIHEIITKNFKFFGDKDSEIIRNILIAYIAEKGLLRGGCKNEKS